MGVALIEPRIVITVFSFASAKGDHTWLVRVSWLRVKQTSTLTWLNDIFKDNFAVDYFIVVDNCLGEERL